MDVNEMIAKAQAKQEKKNEKKGVTRATADSTVTRAAHASTRRIEDPRFKDIDKKDVHYEEAAKNADPHSITAKANMVARYDELHGKKKSGSGQNSRRRRDKNSRNRRGREANSASEENHSGASSENKSEDTSGVKTEASSEKESSADQKADSAENK